MNDILKAKVIEIVETHKGTNLELIEKLRDFAKEYNTTLLHVIGYVEGNLTKETNGGMSFNSNKDIDSEYVEDRFKGKE